MNNNMQALEELANRRAVILQNQEIMASLQQTSTRRYSTRSTRAASSSSSSASAAKEGDENKAPTAAGTRHSSRTRNVRTIY